MTRPTEPIEWAELAAAGDVTEPPTGVRDAGYQFEDILPHEELNAVLRGVYRWLRHTTYAGGGGAYDSLSDAFTDSNIIPGDGFVIKDNEQPLGLLEDVAGGGNIESLHAANGYIAAMLSDGGVDLLKDSATGFSVLITDVATAVGPWRRVFCGTDALFVIDATELFVYAYDGTLLWSYDHGATITAVDQDSVRVYIVGVSGTNGDGTGTHRGLALADGTHLWTQAWGATLNAVQALSDTLLIGGSVSGGFYAAEISKGAGTLVRNIIVPAAVLATYSICSDGVDIFAMTGSGLYRFPYSTGDYALSSAVTGEGIFDLDDAFFYVVESAAPSNVKVYPKASGRELELQVQAGSTSINAISTDGRRLWVGYDNAGGDVLSVFATTGRNKRFQYASTDAFKPTGRALSAETTVF
jgi:hypothetical protein